MGRPGLGHVCGAWFTRARVLVTRATLQDGDPAARSLLSEAVEDYRRACALDSRADFHNALATARLHLVALTPSDERAALPLEAEAACKEANRLQPGTADYNLVCVYASLGRHEAAEAHLLSDLPRWPSPSAQARHALKDPDLARLLESRPDLRARVTALAEANEP